MNFPGLEITFLQDIYKFSKTVQILVLQRIKQQLSGWIKIQNILIFSNFCSFESLFSLILSHFEALLEVCQGPLVGSGPLV